MEDLEPSFEMVKWRIELTISSCSFDSNSQGRSVRPFKPPDTAYIDSTDGINVLLE